VRFAPDGRTLFYLESGEIPAKAYRYDVVSGRKELWKEFAPADTSGLSGITRLVVTPDGKTYAYSYLRILSYLQLVDGMK